LFSFVKLLAIHRAKFIFFKKTIKWIVFIWAITKRKEGTKLNEKDQLIGMKNLACMLHSTYFGTLQALRKEKGFFASCELAEKGISEMLEAYFHLLESWKIPDILKTLEETDLYTDLKIKQEGDTYFFEIGKCLFAGGEKGVHKTIKNIDLPCPIALFVAACISRENPSKKIYIYPSSYDEDGTITQIELLDPEEYSRKMNILSEMSKNRP
jgi:hypothetical protein